MASLLLLNLAFGGIGLIHAQTLSEDLSQSAATRKDIGADARIQVLTRPNGALVFLEGEYEMAGRAPYTITHFLKGPYRIRAIKPGYESWSSDYVFNGRGDDKLSIKLTPKTRFKAFTRSLLFPGWGQVYSDQRVKGFLISLLQLGTAGALIYHDSRYTEALNNYNAALQNFEANKHIQEKYDELIVEVNKRTTKVDNAWETRRRWLIITGSVYLYNLLDAAIFFPSYRREAFDLSLSLNPEAEMSSVAVGVNLKAKF